MNGSNGKINFYDLAPGKLRALLEERFSLPAYRADQLIQWVYRWRKTDFSEMTNLKKDLRTEFSELFEFPELEQRERKISQDGTRKYLFDASGDLIESVMIKQPERMTLCVSSQVGCALACAFCQTGTMGLKRNLSVWEIVGQVVAVRDDAQHFDDMFSNIVFMGMGEPLHNFRNVLDAIEVINHDHGLGLSARKITVSTAGLVPAIKKFADSGTEANLAVSLNATTNEVRNQIMPINKRFPLEVLLETLRDMPLKSRKRVTIEYVMLKGVNDSPADLKRLPGLLRGIPSKVNLIPYNFNTGLGFECPDPELPKAWQRELNRHGLVATIRWSKGVDIDAACGQLVTKSKQASRVAGAA